MSSTDTTVRRKAAYFMYAVISTLDVAAARRLLVEHRLCDIFAAVLRNECPSVATTASLIGDEDVVCRVLQTLQPLLPLPSEFSGNTDAAGLMEVLRRVSSVVDANSALHYIKEYAPAL